MAILDIAILGLYGVAAFFAIIELGLSGYLVHLFNNVYYDYTGYYGLVYTASDTAKSRADFLLFASLWTLVIIAILLIFSVTFARRTTSAGWATPVTLVLNALTMIFWLAGFAAWANLVGTSIGVAAAALAFAILLWIVFLALTVFGILTAVNAVSSDRFGYGGMTRKTTVP